MGTQYIFGFDGDGMVLKTIGDVHTDLSGMVSVTVRTDVDEVTHSCRIERKCRSAEGADGQCYDWYAVSGYFRDTSKTARVEALEEENKLLREQIAAQADQAEFYEDCIAEMAAVVYA